MSNVAYEVQRWNDEKEEYVTLSGPYMEEDEARLSFDNHVRHLPKFTMRLVEVRMVYALMDLYTPKEQE